MSIFANLKRLVTSRANRVETQESTDAVFDDAELYEYVQGCDTAKSRRTSLAEQHEAELKELNEQIRAQRLLLEQAEQTLTDEGVAYVELRAFLRGDMPAADVISILGRTQTTKH